MNDYELSLQTEWDLLDMDDHLEYRLDELHKKLTYQLHHDLWPRYRSLNISLNLSINKNVKFQTF